MHVNVLLIGFKMGSRACLESSPSPVLPSSSSDSLQDLCYGDVLAGDSSTGPEFY